MEKSKLSIKEFKIDRSIYDHYDKERVIFKAKPGINEEIVKEISKQKQEPKWMLEKRLQALNYFKELKMPDFGPNLKELDLSKIHFFIRPDAKKNAESWEDVPEDIRKTFDRLGIPEAEKKVLAGVGSQYDSESIYHKLKEEWKSQGVIFLDCDEALKLYPELFKKYFMSTCVPVNLHKFSALHAAVWSGGTFIYIPKNVKVKMPLQAYFRMNAKSGGQFEHTLIIVDEGAEVHYIEGCSSPVYNESGIHAGCVEIHVLKGARARYSSIENWSKNTYNLNTKRAIVYEDGIIEWVNGNMGCLTEDSKIFTNPKGPVEIKSIEPGDKVYVWDEKSNNIKTALVKAKIFSGYKKVYNLMAGGREIEASANHPFLSLKRKKHHPSHKKGFFYYEWLPLENLKKGNLIAIAKKIPIEGKPYTLPKIRIDKTVKSKNQYSHFTMKINHLYNTIIIPEETNEEFMWLMGILLGDGHIDIKNNKINIATHETEDYRKYLCDLLERLFSYKVSEKKERYIIINSKVLCKLFSEIGFGGNADTKKIPKWVFSLPENQMMAFLAGYFDSDGHAHGAAIAFTSINKRILNDLKYLGISLGFCVSKVFKHSDKKEVKILGKICQTNDSWRILFNGYKLKELPIKSMRKIGKISFDKIRRKYVSSNGLNFKSKVNDEIGFVKIKEIKETGVKPTFDIEVENFHNFISNGLIVHNSHVTMLYPTSILVGDRSKANFIGIAFAGKDQNQDTGSKVIHIGKNTSSNIQSKSISKDGGITSYRGLVSVKKNALNTKSKIVCDALMVDNISQSNTFPSIDVKEDTTDLAHEATVGKISEEIIFYLMSRGLDEITATNMIVSGFIEPIVKELPLEYAVELNRLIQLEMEGSLG